MRLGKEAKLALHETARRALSGPCVVQVPARSRSLAYRIFDSVTPHMEQLGAVPQPRVLEWQFPNGSKVRIVNGQDAKL